MNKIKYDNNKLTAFCIKHHIEKLAFFGSAIRDDFNESSDIDLLVEFKKGHVPGFFKIYDMEEELKDIFMGRKVDLRTKEDLSHFFRDEVIRDMKIQYEA